MRFRFLIQVFSLLVVVAAGALWRQSRSTALELQARLAVLTSERGAAQRLVRQRDTLRSQLSNAARSHPAESARAVTPLPPPDAPLASLALGEWRTSKEWRNEGQSTARAAVSTWLWSASGGDLAAMTPLLALDDAARKEARKIFDALPPAARQAFGSPEAMVAGMLSVAVPNNAAQLSWYHERDDAHASVGLLLRDASAPALALAPNVPGKNEPPSLPMRIRGNKFATLALERSPSGWRIVLPAVAVRRIARGAASVPAH